MVDVAVEAPARLLVFVHIPKTAGTTLRTVLGMNEPGRRSRALGNVFKGGGGVSRALIERLRGGKGPDLTGVRLIRGHFPLGIREYLPEERELAIFTFLRDPADRTLSHFFAIHEMGRGYGLPPLGAEATLEEALAGGYLHDNLQTRMLSGQPEPFGEVDEAMLEQAKHNLSHGLAFFGLTERFDESLVLAKQRLGLRAILYRTSGRVNTARPRGQDVPEELRRAAEACNQYDIELYRHAQQLFDQAPERRELEFQIELAALTAAKAEGPIDPHTPPPAAYNGDIQTWPTLLHAKAMVLRLEFERTRHRSPRVSATVQEEALESKLSAARSRARRLEQEVERLRGARSRSKRLERDVERLSAAASKAERLEQQVERLKVDRARSRELQKEVEQLRVAAARTEELEKEVERLGAAAARVVELEKEVERLGAAAARAEELETELEVHVERLAAARSRKDKLEQKVERLRTTAAGRRGGPKRGDDL